MNDYSEEIPGFSTDWELLGLIACMSVSRNKNFLYARWHRCSGHAHGPLSLNISSVLHAHDHSRFFTVSFHRSEIGEMGSHRSHIWVMGKVSRL